MQNTASMLAQRVSRVPLLIAKETILDRLFGLVDYIMHSGTSYSTTVHAARVHKRRLIRHVSVLTDINFKFIYFITALNIRSPLSEREIIDINQEMVKFLDFNKILYSFEPEYKVDQGFIYFYTPIKIKFSESEYEKFSNEFIHNNIVSGWVRECVFEINDSLQLLLKLLMEAEIKAQVIAESIPSQLSKIIRIEEVIKKDQWNVGPPFTAKINHFIQEIYATYNVSFEVIPY